jgi:hypothetical protein
MKTVTHLLIIAMIALHCPAAPAADTTFFNMDKPLPPRGHTVDESLANISESQMDYSTQCQNANAAACSQTFAFIKKRYDELLVKDQAVEKSQAGVAGGCTADQTDLQACNAKNLKSVASGYKQMSQEFQNTATELESKRMPVLEQSAQKILDSWKHAYPPPSDAGMINIATGRLNDAKSSQAINSQDQRHAYAATCIASFNPHPANFSGIDSFCQILGAFQEAKYYAQKLKDSSSATASEEKKYETAAAKGDDNVKKGGTETPDPKKADPKSGLFGLDTKDWLGIGMLGMMGAGLFCSTTGQCSPNKGNQSNITDPNANSNLPSEQAAATAPTPTSANNSQAGLGNSTGTDGSGTSAIGNGQSGTLLSNTGTGTQKFVATDGGATPNSGSGTSDNAAAQGAFNRSLASPFGGSYSPAGGIGAGAGGGGKSGGGGALVSTDGKSEEPAAKPSAESTYGGSGGSSAGFSLGGGGSTDSALKSILNGDTPPAGGLPGGDLGAGALPSLDALGDAPGAGGAAQTQAAAGAEDGPSIFSRVRDTHLRCMRRGCVIYGVGKNI